MATILETKSIYFNDVNLLPKPGKVRSRKDIPNELYRIIVSPMLAIIGETFTQKAANLGLSLALPRFISTEKKIALYDIFQKNKIHDKQLCFISIGLQEPLSEIQKIHITEERNNVLIDIANGYIPHLAECTSRMYHHTNSSSGTLLNNLMVGNVVTQAGISKIYSGINSFTNNLFIRVGIGNGSPCASSDVAAINRGQITELIECAYVKWRFPKLKLVSDGGIYKSGFVLKAFGAGADYCLMGGYFVKSLEAETHISGDGTYFGCASEKQNKLAGLDKHSEGKEFLINKTELKSLKYLVNELWGGICSGISYCGYDTVSDFIGNGIFEIKQNSLPPKNRY